MLKIGLDIGSRNTKLVVFDDAANRIKFSNWSSTGVSPRVTAEELIHKAMQEMELERKMIDKWAVTGYGRKLFPEGFKVLSEINCHAHGCLYYQPLLQTIVDIGGQDSKVICLDENGKIREFVMNDKCAAGTGRFLEMTALRLDMEVEDLSALAAFSKEDLKLNSTCVVFAESEIIGMLATAVESPDIIKAVHYSIANRIKLQMAGLDWQEPLGFTGGVAMNSDLATCLGKVLGCSVWTPEEPETTAALGAAILA